MPLSRLTGDGWLKGLEFTGEITYSSIRQQALTLVKALKDRTTRGEDKLELVEDFAVEGLSGGFVCNAVDSGLLDAMFKGRGYSVRWQHEGKIFVIPRRFGHSSIGL